MADVFCIVPQTGRLSDPTRKTVLRTPLAYSDTEAHSMRFIAIGEGGTPADLTDVGVTGAFKAADGGTVKPLTGTVSGNTAEVILPAACYAVPGRFTFSMFLSASGRTRTVMWVEGIVEKNVTNDGRDPGTPITNIEAIIGNANAAATRATQAAEQAEAVVDAGIATAAETLQYLGYEEEETSNG